MNERAIKNQLTEIVHELTRYDESLSPHIKELMRKVIASKVFTLYLYTSEPNEVMDKCKEMIDCIEGFYHEQEIIKQGL